MKSKKLTVLLLLLMLLGGYAIYEFFIKEKPPLVTVESPASPLPKESRRSKHTEKSKRSKSIDVSTPKDSTRTSQFKDSTILKKSGEPLFTVEKDGGKSSYKGQRVNIAVIGVDARIGAGTKHADANHVVSILLDSGRIEIISIPRDTPADAGFSDTSSLNKLTIVHANRGLRTYLSEASRIAGVGKIDYYVEFGFSQAMGIIELLGHKDSKSTLQVLRSRQGLGGDDYQRCYNQGQFIRQNILKNFGRADGFFGEVFIRGGLLLVETNLTADNISQIISQLKDKGFPKDSSAISVRVRPSAGNKFKLYDFSNESTILSLKNKIERYNQSKQKQDNLITNSTKPDIHGQLRRIISNARLDSAKYPKQVIRRLSMYFDQHAWLQISDKKQRESVRSEMEALLSNAYLRINKLSEADKIHAVVNTEKQMFEHQEKSKR
ncbi:MAG: LCP family protein [Ignavibacteria bacterium]|nr:LCP family protein [Ignavibacteria bacterium]